MKLIVDVGTNKYNEKSTTLLLHHFLKWYDDIGVSHYHIHGNVDLINHIKALYSRNNITYHQISVDQYDDYKQRDSKLCYEQNNLGTHRVYRTTPGGNNSCPLYMIQNDIKNKYISDDELCFVLDLDEFVDIDIDTIQDKTDYIRGDVYDMFGSNGLLPRLRDDKPIMQQLHTPVKLQQASKRPCRKIIATRGNIQHCFGHHNLLEMQHNYTAAKQPVTVYHMKWFHENVDYLKACPHAKGEMKLLQFGKDIHVRQSVWNDLTQ